MNRQVFQCGPAGRFGQDAGFSRGLFEKFAMFFGKGYGHKENYLWD